MKIGDRIKGIREASNISQTDLANKIGVSKQTLYKYENGIVTNIPSDKIESISKILRCSPAYLMGWEDTFSKESADLDVEISMDVKFKQLYFYWRQLNELGKDKLIDNASDLAKIYLTE